MPLETLVSELISVQKELLVAVKDLTAALQAAPTGSRKKGTAQQEVAAPQTPAAPSAPQTPAAPAAPVVTAKDFQVAFVKLAEHPNNGYARANQVLANFKVERAGFLKPEQLADALKQVQAALAEVEAAKPPSAASLI